MTTTSVTSTWEQAGDEPGGGAAGRSDFAAEFERWPARGAAESDFFCDRCGYNLHGQSARQDPRTDVLLLRCPECGKYHPAVSASSIARLWVERLSRAALVTWLFLAYWCVGVLVIVHTGVMDGALQLISQAAGRVGPEIGQHLRAVTDACGVSALLGLVAALVGRIVFPHWKWWSLVVASFAWPAVSATVTIVWIRQFAAMRYVENSLEYIAVFAAAFVAGGLVGTAVARPAARLALRVVLPPRARQAFTHLYRQTAGSPQRA